MKPALTTLLLWPAIPGDGKCLHATIREFYEVLLQWIDAERVLDFKDRQIAVGAVSLNDELPIFLEKARMHAVIFETRVVKIAKHGFGGRMLHGMLVLGGVPQVCFGVVAAGTGFTTDKRCRNDNLGTKFPKRSVIFAME